ncbi:MAG TPA: thioredoxin family protein [Chitinispirillaceae bacterium]|nr:thioredoxin family protein [Chitinispirillaceae bacterium]
MAVLPNSIIRNKKWTGKKNQSHIKVTDINEILKFGVMMTPALAVDGEVKVYGKVPKPDEIKKMIA